MLHLHLSNHDGQPLYLQLYNQLRHQIRSGAIAHDNRLPSIRSLQHQLNISKTTIETAYHMLAAEGYVISKPRSGWYAINPLGTHPSPAPRADRLAAVDQDAGYTYRVDFKPSAVDEHMFPIRIWRKMLHLAMENHAGSIGQYGDPQGEYALRACLADYLHHSRGVICSPEQIVIGSGIAYSMGILAKLFRDRRRVGFEEPGFAPVREQWIQNGFEVIPIPVNDRGLSLAELDNSGTEIVYVTPSHQFPTGCVMPYTEREYLLKWANASNALIIEDDYDGEFRYLGKPISSLQSLDRCGSVIYIGTFSKVFTPSLRMNYMVLPKKQLEQVLAMPYLLDAPSRIEQWAMQHFIEQGHWYRHIRRMRNTYRKKHQHILSLLTNTFGDSVEITGHRAGLHLQIAVKTRQPAHELVRRAATNGIRVYDLQETWMTSSQAKYPHIYIGFGGISEKDMASGIKQLEVAWSDILEG